jgi:hypothetical protein
MADDTPKCFHCGSNLILISEKSVKRDGSIFPSIVSTYKCSDQKCQNEIDKNMEKRNKMQSDKEKIEKKRVSAKISKSPQRNKN